jgi:hypothetical protein
MRNSQVVTAPIPNLNIARACDNLTPRLRLKHLKHKINVNSI